MIKTRPESLLIIVFWLLTCLAAFSGLGKILNIIFPASTFLIGYYLYSRNPLSYLNFVLWVWLLSPLLRRVSDHYGSYSNPSPILLGPPFVTIVCLMSFLNSLKYPPTIIKLHFFAMPIMGILYGFLVSLVNGADVSAVKSLLDWLPPVLLGYYIYSNWKIYPELEKSIMRIFLGFLVVGGTYGIFQYLTAPPWDSSWLVNLRGSDVELLGSPFGIPVPLGIRVWSTLNGPLDFAVVMLASLMLTLTSKSPFVIPFTALGYLSFFLSLVRTAWIGLSISILLMFFSISQSQQIRLIITLFTLVALIIPLTSISPFSEAIAPRIESLFSIEDDGSGNARSTTYSELLGPALTSFLGYGIGNVPNFGYVLDSSALDILFSLGWIGTFLYLSGLVLGITNSVSNGIRKDVFTTSLLSVILSILTMGVLGPIHLGVGGIILWSFLGLMLAEKTYSISSDAPKASPAIII